MSASYVCAAHAAKITEKECCVQQKNHIITFDQCSEDRHTKCPSRNAKLQPNKSITFSSFLSAFFRPDHARRGCCVSILQPPFDRTLLLWGVEAIVRNLLISFPLVDRLTCASTTILAWIASITDNPFAVVGIAATAEEKQNRQGQKTCCMSHLIPPPVHSGTYPSMFLW